MVTQSEDVAAIHLQLPKYNHIDQHVDLCKNAVGSSLEVVKIGFRSKAMLDLQGNA